MATDIRTRVEYPSSDGKPMADSTLQFQWIVRIEGGLDAEFRDDPNVFVAGDLLWYPVEGEPSINAAPDTMVVFGRPKGHRRSYLQWEEAGIGPQVAFEILSHSNTHMEMADKYEFYESHGVEEYYVYDPETAWLAGWLRRGDVFRRIPRMAGWVSPRLGVRFEIGTELELYGRDGRRFADYLEIIDQRQQAEARADAAERQAMELAAEVARLKALLPPANPPG